MWAVNNNISDRSVRRILKINTIIPGNEDNPDRRIEFCHQMMDVTEDNTVQYFASTVL